MSLWSKLPLHQILTSYDIKGIIDGGDSIREEPQKMDKLNFSEKKNASSWCLQKDGREKKADAQNIIPV